MPYALCLYTGGRGGAETCRREEVQEAQTGEALNQGTPFYLLYWYKSTNTDAEDAPRSFQSRYSILLAVLVQKYKY
jgi:hypothetical protein